MGYDSGFPERILIHNVVGPLGWTLKMMARAADCSIATLQNDLPEGIKSAFPDRPTGTGSYAATFKWYLGGVFPSDRVKLLAEEYLEIERIKGLAEGMAYGLTALQAHVHPSEVDGYIQLLAEIFRIQVPTGHVPPEPLRYWYQYLEDVRAERADYPGSSASAIQGVARLLQESDDRLKITVPLLPGLPEALDEAMNDFDDRVRLVIRRRFGLEPGSASATYEQIGGEIGCSKSRVAQLEDRALRKLRHPSRSDALRIYVRWGLDAVVAHEAQLRELVPVLETSISELEGRYDSLVSAVQEGVAEAHLREAGIFDLREVLMISVDDLDLSVRTSNCFYSEKIERVWQIVERSEVDLLKMKNSGRKTVAEIKRVLSELDPPLELGMQFSERNRSKLQLLSG